MNTLSSELRRLYEEATRDCRGTDELIAKQRARRAARNALPALADLVAAVESELGLGPALPGKPLSDALAALRERLETRP